MKSRLLNTVAAAAFGLAAMASAASADKVSGFIGLSAGGVWFSGDDGTDYSHATQAFAGEAEINTWLAPNWSAQLDLSAEGTNAIYVYGNGSDYDGRVGGIFGGHVSYREANFLLGGFAGYAVQNNLDYDGTMTHVILGVEGQYRWPEFTVYAQAGYAPLLSDSDEYEPEGFGFGRLVGRYFFTKNDKVEGEFGYGRSDINDEPGEFDIYTWGLSWQHRYENSPFSTTIAYAGLHNSDDYDDYTAEESLFTVSLNIHFGDASLAETNANGATLDMPIFERAFAYSYFVGN